MNEDLRIVIRADSENAQQNIKKTKDELKALAAQSEKTEKYIDDTMASIKKGVTVALAAVTAIVAGMVALGKQAQENQKQIGRLTTTFQNLGSSAKQAKQTYTELYKFLGDSATATEAANLLAQITTEEKELTQWTRILQGVYATFPDSLPVEALAEATNETIKVGKVTGNLADAVNWLGVSEDAVNQQLTTLNTTAEREAYLRELLNSLYGTAADLYAATNAELIAHNQAQAQLDSTLASTTKTLTPMLTALINVANVMLTALKPAIEVVSAAVIVLCQWLTTLVSWLGSFFDIGGGFDGVAASVNNANNSISNMGNGLKENLQTANDLKKATMGFDELNVVSKPTDTSGGGGGSGAVKVPVAIPQLDLSAIEKSSKEFEKKLEKVRETMKAILTLALLVGAAILAWKIIDAYTAGVSFFTVFKNIFAQAILIAGAMVTIIGYSDAWVNGVDWKNMLLTLSGMVAVIASLYIQFGSLGAAIGVVAAGVALLVLGVVDFIKNGPTVENTILIIGGAVAIAVGLATAGLSVLVAAIVAAVAAVGAFIAAICLEEPAIMSVDEAQKNLTATKEAAAQAEMGYINAIDAAEAAMNKLAEAEAAAGVTGAELYAQVQSGTLDYANMTDAQKEVYKAYLDNEQKQKELEESTKALNEAKKAETLASLENSIALGKESGNYDKAKESILAAYNEGAISAEECRDLMSKAMSEMSDDAQQTFMKDLPGDIQNGLNPHKYESTGTKIKKWFKNVWSDIKGFFSDAGQWFANVGKTVGEALGSAFKKVINGVLKLIEESVNAPFKLINAGIDILNKVPGISISKLKLIDVPELATGGVVTGDTIARIGEQGYKEAVLPLERNTEWMDVLAARVADRTATPSKIVLTLDGKELGYAAINSINGITQQTGNLGLILV